MWEQILKTFFFASFFQSVGTLGRTSILGGWWCGVVWCELEDHRFFPSIHSAKCPFLYSSISSNHPSTKFVVRQGIESVRSPNSSDDLCLLFCMNLSSIWLYRALSLWTAGVGISGGLLYKMDAGMAGVWLNAILSLSLSLYTIYWIINHWKHISPAHVECSIANQLRD